MSQGCISPDGRLSERALELLKLLLERGGLPDTAIAEALGRPLFQVRSSLRELVNAGFLEKKEEIYFISDKGKNYLNNL